MDYYDSQDQDSRVRSLADITSKTEIQQYYANATILITGASGFLGTLLVEKLLRSCSDIKKIILLIRPKKGKTPIERLKVMLSNVVFEKMLKSTQNCLSKLEVIEGDCEKYYYGIEMTEWQKLQQEINFIFHAAATIRFDDHIRISYNINVAATKYLLKLAKGMPFLKGFVYVSTFYSQCHLNNIEEKFYPPGITDEEFFQFLEKLDDTQLACFTPLILNGRINNYILTKGMAEDLIAKCVGKLPVAVFRPPIVTNTIEEPKMCWSNSVAGAIGVFVGTGAGLLRVLNCDPDAKAEIVPADRVINCLIAIPLHLEKQRQFGNKEFTPVYNYVAKPEKSLKWQQLLTLLEAPYTNCGPATNVALWKHHLTFEKNHFIYLMKFYIMHLLPAPIFMLIERLSRRKPMIWKLYVRMFYFIQLMSHFMLHTWKLNWNNVKDLLENLSPDDKILFNSDNEVDWKPYFYYELRGSGAYILNVQWNDPYSVIKQTLIPILDSLIVHSYKILKIFLIWKFASMAFAYILRII